MVNPNNQDYEIKKQEKAWWQPGLMIFARSLSWLAGPVIISVFLGKWLDTKFGTDPWLLVISVGIAFIVSMVGIIGESTKQFKEIEKDGRQEEKVKSKK